MRGYLFLQLSKSFSNFATLSFACSTQLLTALSRTTIKSSSLSSQAASPFMTSITSPAFFRQYSLSLTVVSLNCLSWPTSELSSSMSLACLSAMSWRRVRRSVGRLTSYEKADEVFTLLSGFRVTVEWIRGSIGQGDYSSPQVRSRINLILSMNDVNSEFDYAVELTAQSKYPQAIARFGRALQVNPRHFASLLNRGTLYSILQLWPLAQQDFTAAMSLQPSDPTSYYNRFVVQVSTKRYKQALADLYCALSCMHVQRGVALQDLQHFNTAIALVESNHFAYIERAELYRLQDQDKLALNDLNYALELDPTNRRALCLRCALERAEEDYERAEKDHQLVLTLATSSAAEALPLQIQFGDMPHHEIMRQIDLKLRQLKQLRSEPKTNVNVPMQPFTKTRSAINFTREPQSNIRVEQRDNSESREDQSLNAKLSKLISEQKVGMVVGSASGDEQQQQLTSKGSKQDFQPLLSQRSEHSESKGSLVEIASSDKNVDQQSNKAGGSKIHQIKKLADLVIDDQDLKMNKSLLHLPRTPQAGTPQDRSLSSRTHGSISQIIKPIGKKWFEVQVVAAALTHNTELLGSMSPYCTLIYQNEVKTSKVVAKGGKNPVWNESFTFLIKQSNLLKVQVWDKETIKKDDFVGSGSCSIYDASSKCLLRHDSKPAGTVYLKVKLM